MLAAYRERGDALWTSDLVLRAYGFDRIEWQAVGAFGLRVQVWRGARWVGRELGPRQLAAARDPLAMRLDCLDEMCAELGGAPAGTDLAALAAAVVLASRELRAAENAQVPGCSIAELETAAPEAQRRTGLALLRWRSAVDALLEAEWRSRQVPAECDACRATAAQALAAGKVGYMRCSACLALDEAVARLPGCPACGRLLCNGCDGTGQERDPQR